MVSNKDKQFKEGDSWDIYQKLVLKHFTESF